MSLKNHLQTLQAEYQVKQPKVAEENAEALAYMKNTLISAAKRGAQEFSFTIIKLVSGTKYQVQSGVEDAIELSHPEYLQTELVKENLNVTLVPKKNSKNFILTCSWSGE